MPLSYTVTPCFLSCSPLSPRRLCGRCAPRGEHISKRFVPHHDCVEPPTTQSQCASRPYTPRAAVSPSTLTDDKMHTPRPRLCAVVEVHVGTETAEGKRAHSAYNTAKFVGRLVTRPRPAQILHRTATLLPPAAASIVIHRLIHATRRGVYQRYRGLLYTPLSALILVDWCQLGVSGLSGGHTQNSALVCAVYGRLYALPH